MSLRLKKWLSTSLFLLAGCSTPLAFMHEGQRHADLAFEEMRIEIADLKHALSNTQVALQLLEDQYRNSQKQSAKPVNASELSALHSKIDKLEKSYEKAISDLKQISTHAHQTQAAFAQFKDKMHDLESEILVHSRRLDEVSKLKNTLMSLTASLKEKNKQDVQ